MSTIATLKTLHFLGLLAEMLLRFPHERQRRQTRIVVDRVSGLERLLIGLVAVGLFFLPIIHTFTSWLNWADYRLSPRAIGQVGEANEAPSAAGNRIWELTGGVLVCGGCGWAMQADKRRNKSGNAYYYYRCGKKKDHGTGTSGSLLGSPPRQRSGCTTCGSSPHWARPRSLWRACLPRASKAIPSS